jgi:hypothetical protein
MASERKMLSCMKPAYWYTIVALGVSMSYILCFLGFWEMNSKLIVNHVAHDPPLPSWYSGLTMFFSGMIPSIIAVGAERRFNNEVKSGVYLRIASVLKVFKISFLIMVALLDFSA